jgi:hypothetical protein
VGLARDLEVPLPPPLDKSKLAVEKIKKKAHFEKVEKNPCLFNNT